MEPQLGADLSQVKIGTGAPSDRAADKLGARAFTVGTDVHFSGGQFAPGTKEGDRLIAHELVHAVQGQRQGVSRKPEADRASDEEVAREEDGAEAQETEQAVEVSQPDEPAEQEADAVADDVAESLHDRSDRREEGEAEEAAEQPEREQPAIAAKLAGVGRKVYRAPVEAAPAPAPAPAVEPANPHAGKLAGDPRSYVKTACAGDRLAMQKLADVEREQDLEDTPPMEASDRFFAAVADKINADPNLDLKHAYNTADFQGAARPFLKQGRKLDRSKITQLCSRTVRIENWWKYNCVQTPYLADAAKIDGIPPGDVPKVAEDLFRLDLSNNPGKALSTLDRSKPISPPGMHGWFSDDKVRISPGHDAGFGELMHVYALQPEVFAEGTIFIECDPARFTGEARKPTAYDGMQSVLWVPRPGENFGITGGGFREFLADAVPGASVVSASARVPTPSLRAEILAFNDAMKAGGSASAPDALVRGDVPSPAGGGEGASLVKSVVETTQNERENPSAPRSEPTP